MPEKRQCSASPHRSAVPRVQRRLDGKPGQRRSIGVHHQKRTVPSAIAVTGPKKVPLLSAMPRRESRAPPLVRPRTAQRRMCKPRWSFFGLLLQHHQRPLHPNRPGQRIQQAAQFGRRLERRHEGDAGERHHEQALHTIHHHRRPFGVYHVAPRVHEATTYQYGPAGYGVACRDGDTALCGSITRLRATALVFRNELRLRPNLHAARSCLLAATIAGLVQDFQSHGQGREK